MDAHLTVDAGQGWRVRPVKQRAFTRDKHAWAAVAPGCPAGPHPHRDCECRIFPNLADALEYKSIHENAPAAGGHQREGEDQNTNTHEGEPIMTDTTADATPTTSLPFASEGMPDLEPELIIDARTALEAQATDPHAEPGEPSTYKELPPVMETPMWVQTGINGFHQDLPRWIVNIADANTRFEQFSPLDARAISAALDKAAAQAEILNSSSAYRISGRYVTAGELERATPLALQITDTGHQRIVVNNHDTRKASTFVGQSFYPLGTFRLVTVEHTDGEPFLIVELEEEA